MGTTIKPAIFIADNKDHPHIRGDHHAVRLCFTHRRGSPPHTWGPPPLVVSSAMPAGITPTYVGTTTHNIVITNPIFKDHPHIRGDHKRVLRWPGKGGGSPPHTWGPLEVYDANGTLRGITPTYVGTTTVLHSFLLIIGDHPHIRGDHPGIGRAYYLTAGSPPHTWGPRKVMFSDDGIERITPTYVGTTIS